MLQYYCHYHRLASVVRQSASDNKVGTVTGAMIEKLALAERAAASTNERAEKLQYALEVSKREVSEVNNALNSSESKIANLEADLTGFQTALEQVTDLRTELSARDIELQQLKDGSNPPVGGGNSNHDWTTEVTGKIKTTHEAAKSLANQMGLPFYESSTGSDNGELDAVRILLEGVGFGIQRQQQRMEEQVCCRCPVCLCSNLWQ